MRPAACRNPCFRRRWRSRTRSSSAASSSTCCSALGQILVMIDADGDENYVPHVIPLDGGFPEPLADELFSGGRSHLVHVDDDAEIAYFAVESREEASITAVRVHLRTRASRGALAELVRRDGRRVDSRPFTRRARGRLHDGGHGPLRDRRGRYPKNALRSSDRRARSRGAAALGRIPQRVRDSERCRRPAREHVARRHGLPRVSRSLATRRRRACCHRRPRAPRRRRARRARPPRR